MSEKGASPYVGMTLRLGKQEINVHDVKDGVVYYGKYDDDAHDAPEHCVALHQVSLSDWREQFEKALKEGAMVKWNDEQTT